jgi:hypothetical protein
MINSQESNNTNGNHTTSYVMWSNRQLLTFTIIKEDESFVYTPFLWGNEKILQISNELHCKLSFLCGVYFSNLNQNEIYKTLLKTKVVYI